MDEPVIQRPTFNPKYFKVGLGFKLHLKQRLLSIDYDTYTELFKYKSHHVLIKEIRDKGETLVVTLIKEATDDKHNNIAMDLLIKVSEIDNVTFAHLIEPPSPKEPLF